MTATFQPGDIAVIDGAECRVTQVTDEGRVNAVRLDGRGGILGASHPAHVPITAERVGQWARGKDPHGETFYKGRVEDIHQHNTVGLRLADDDYVEVEDAVLVAGPSPAPEFVDYEAPLDGSDRGVPRGWVPTVGARALVVVAEQRTGKPCAEIRSGDIVTLDWRAEDEWGVTAQDGREGCVAGRHLRPALAAPAPDQDDEPEQLPWRVGQHYDIHVYEDDRPVATFHDPEDAALAVSRVNAHAALTARAEHAEAEVRRLRAESDEAIRRGDEAMVMAGRLREQRDQARETCRSAADHALACEAERDAARAELAAAGTTDGLGLPQVEVVTARGIGSLPDRDVFTCDGLLSGYVTLDDVGQRLAAEELAAAERRVRRLRAVAAARARLAQEAPTTKDDDRG